MVSARMRENWPISGIMVFEVSGKRSAEAFTDFHAAHPSPLTAHRLLSFLRLLHRMRSLRRHVVLVVLGEDLRRLEHAVRGQLPLRHHPFALLEEVRKYAGIDDRNHFCR